MRRLAFSRAGIVALAGVVGSMVFLSGPAAGDGSPKEGRPPAGAVAQARDDLASKLTRREVQRAPASIPGRGLSR